MSLPLMWRDSMRTPSTTCSQGGSEHTGDWSGETRCQSRHPAERILIRRHWPGHWWRATATSRGEFRSGDRRGPNRLPRSCCCRRHGSPGCPVRPRGPSSPRLRPRLALSRAEATNLNDPPARRLSASSRQNPAPAACIEDFPSVSHALHAGYSTTLYNSLQTGKPYKGLVWSYVDSEPDSRQAKH